jgi:hypothetical protein
MALPCISTAANCYFHTHFSTLHTSISEQACQRQHMTRMCTLVNTPPSDGNIYKYMPHAFKSIYSTSHVAISVVKKKLPWLMKWTKAHYLCTIMWKYVKLLSIPVAERSKVWVCSRSPAGIAGSNPAGGMDGCPLWVLCVCQVQVSATSWSLVQRTATDCGASLCVISKPQEWGG